MALRVGIVGTGWGVRAQVPAFRRAGLNVVALCGRDLAKTQKITRDLNIPHAFNDWRAMVKHEEIDIVSVVTPPDTHANISIEALRAGKHVLCDKPTAFDAKEAAAMAKAAQAAPNQVAWIDHELRFLDITQKMRAAIHDPGFGRIVAVDMRLLATFPTPAFTWWHDAKAGGGLLGALGSHMVDLATYLTGQHVVSVQGKLAAIKKQLPDESGAMREVTADHYVNGSLNFSGGVLGSILMSSHYPMAPERRVTVVGEHRVATLDLQVGSLLVSEGRNEVLKVQETLPSKAETGMEENVWCAGSVLIGKAIQEAVAARRAKTVSPQDQIACSFAGGVYVQEALDAFRESAATHNTVKLKEHHI